MTNQEILEKAIQKAIDGGWQKIIDDYPATFESLSGTGIGWNTKRWSKPGGFYYSDAYTLIFNHDFAKALWGEKEYTPAKYVKHREYFTMPATGDVVHEVNLDRMEYDLAPGGWQYHLQQMVLADDPIRYLGEHLPE